MERRLIKIAKELNVGTQTIVDHLNHNGFDVENKPTAKITDEMYAVLLKEFQKSLNDKEKADQMIIGNRATTTTVKKELPVTPTIKPERPSFPKSDGKADPGTTDGHQEEKSGEPHVEERPRLLQNRLKVLGKIELDARGNRVPEVEKIETPPPAPPPPPPPPPPPAPEPVAVVIETPVEPARQEPVPPATPTPPPTPVEIIQPEIKSEPTPVSEPKKPEVVPTPVAKAPEETKDETKLVPKGDENLMRAETPELRGLKIQGKIDIDKFKKPQKKKDPRERDKPKAQPGTGSAPDQRPAVPGEERKKPQPGGTTPGTPGSAADDAAKKKRKRKRKKLNGPNEGGGGNTQPGGNTQQSGGGGGGGNTQGGGGGGDQNRARRTGSGGGNNNSPQGGGQRSEPTPELSQREIEEKIKATMARISGAGGKKKRQKLSRDKRDRFRERQELIDLEKEGGKLQLTEFISVSELASLMDVSVSEVIMTCMNIGVIVSINQRLDAEVIELVASEFGHEVEFISA